MTFFWASEFCLLIFLVSLRFVTGYINLLLIVVTNMKKMQYNHPTPNPLKTGLNKSMHICAFEKRQIPYVPANKDGKKDS